jgi:RecB family exonuclease
MPLSASTLNKLEDCPLAWFLAHEARGDTPATVALGFGKVVHALADLVARGRLAADEESLVRELDRVWPALGYDVPWQQNNEREQAKRALHRLVGQLAAERGRVFIDSEVTFERQVDTETGPVLLRGRMDRVEADADGRYVVVDLKTGKSKLSTKELPTDRQLALYQFIVDTGGAPGLPSDAASGGAELWQLRDAGPDLPTVQQQPPPAGGHDALVSELGAARGTILAEGFFATPGKGCDRCTFRRSCPAQDDGRTVVE